MNTSTVTTARGSAPAIRRGGPVWSRVLLDLFGRIEAKDLELEREQVKARLVREQVGGDKPDRKEEGAMR